MKTLTGRLAMRSPGRPPIRRDVERAAFLVKIAEGLASEDAAVACGMSARAAGHTAAVDRRPSAL
jgi:hypothetical protein